MKALKEWIADEAIRENVCPHTIACRRLAGWYPALSTIALNKRRIFVERDGTPPRVRLMDWIKAQAREQRVTASAIYARLSRGKYPDLKLDRINRSVIFVS